MVAAPRASGVMTSNLVPAATLADILNGPRPKLVGRLVFDHKTAPSLMLMTEDQARAHDKATRRPGYGTCLKRVSPHRS
jgi:hypothetical protein